MNQPVLREGEGMTPETVTNQPKAEMDRAARLIGLTVRGEREKASMDARKFQQSLHALALIAAIALVIAVAGALGVDMSDHNLNSNDYARGSK